MTPPTPRHPVTPPRGGLRAGPARGDAAGALSDGSGSADIRRPALRPILARAGLAAATLLLALDLGAIVGRPVPAAFLALLAGWLLLSTLALWRLPRAGAPRPSRARFGLFLFEAAVAVVAGTLLEAGAWLPVLFVLFPALEWGLIAPWRWGVAGAVVAAALAGGATAAGALELLPTAPVFGTIAQDLPDGAALAGAAFLVGAGTVAGLTLVVATHARTVRRRGRALERLNAELRRTGAELEASRDDLRTAYARVRDAQAELVASARLATLGTLVAGVAHEINTPLGALNSNHDVLRRSLDRLQAILADERVDESELDDVRRIVRAVDGIIRTNDDAVERILRIVASLRSFGRPDRSEIDRVDLNEGLESTLELLRHELRGRVRVERDLGELPPVECHPNQVNQMFMNLLVNAAQAIDGEGTITLRTRAGEGGVTVEVEDTGVGIPEENLGRVFDPGFTTKGSRVGMGLGLLISRQIVDRHGGRIEVASVPGRGTTFTVWLPLRLPAPPRHDAAPAGAGGDAPGVDAAAASAAATGGPSTGGPA